MLQGISFSLLAIWCSVIGEYDMPLRKSVLLSIIVLKYSLNWCSDESLIADGSHRVGEIVIWCQEHILIPVWSKCSHKYVPSVSFQREVFSMIWDQFVLQDGSNHDFVIRSSCSSNWCSLYRLWTPVLTIKRTRKEYADSLIFPGPQK